MLPFTLLSHSKSAYPYPYASEAEVTSSSTHFLQADLSSVNKAPPITLLASPHLPIRYPPVMPVTCARTSNTVLSSSHHSPSKVMLMPRQHHQIASFSVACCSLMLCPETRMEGIAHVDPRLMYVRRATAPDSAKTESLTRTSHNASAVTPPPGRSPPRS
jgi:hypothetical protein